MKIPDKIFGREIGGAMDRYLNSKKTVKQEKPTTLSVQADINKADYVKIPNTGILIAKIEPNEHKNLNWQDTHYKLVETGLFMPTPALFMPYFMSIIDAHNEKIQLYDGEGNQISKEEVEDIYKHLTTNHINNGAWSHLDALFKNENNAWHIETDHKIINGELKGARYPLEKCLMEDGYASLDFNKQGLATKKSKEQEYKQGENIKFLYPRNGTVAGFYAGSGWANLDCNLDPQVSSAGLGVFPCAEGTPKN